LTVSAAPPQPAVTSSLLSFSAQTANPQPVSQTLGIQNVGGGSVTVNSITAADSFVTISGVPPAIAAGPAIPVTVTVNPAGLAASYYQSAILVNTSAGSLNVPLTLLLAQNPTMTLNPAGTQFQQAFGSTPGNPSGSFQVGVSGNSMIGWNATLLTDASWLTLNTASGTSTSAIPGTVGFSINATAANLAPQAYYSAIQVTSSGVVDSPQTFIVILDVAPAANPAIPDPSPAGLLFLSRGTGAPAPQAVQVFTSSQTPVTYQASSDSPWLVVTPATGSTSTASAGSSSVSVNLSGLASGVYRGNVSYALSSAALPTVNVALIVEPGAGAADLTNVSRTKVGRTNVSRTSEAVTCSPTQLVPTQTELVNNFAQPISWPTPLAVLLVDNCGNPIANGQVAVSFTNGDPPMTLIATDTTSGNYSGTWTPGNTSPNLAIVANAMATGFPMATEQTVGQVTPKVAPVLNPNGTLDAFAIAAEPGAPLAPGTIVQIYGSNLTALTTLGSTIPLATSLDQTSVIIGGLFAPLYYVSPTQINAQVPFELTAGNPYQVIVNAQGALSTPNSIQLKSDAPGIAQYPAGQAIAQHVADNSLITETSPAMPGEYVVLYVAGMGPTNANVASGTASPSANPALALDAPVLTLNGAPVTNVPFAGLTPTLVGLYQIDFQVPASAPNGDLMLVLTQTSGQTASTILPVHN
jgi:adhesin/invasin